MSETSAAEYSRAVAGESDHAPPPAELRRFIPFFALVVGIVAVLIDPSTAADPAVAAIPFVAFAIWAYRPDVPLLALSLVVIIPVVLAQRSGHLEPLFFDVSVLAFVVGRCSSSLKRAAALGLLAAASPVAVSLLQDPSEIAVGIWILGIALPWAIARGLARERELADQLAATQRELAHQALLSERRRIARDVHDLVGHGLAAVMLQITSARHVLRRDPRAAEEALRSAEEVGRRSMQELRRTVGLLRSDDDAGVAAPLPSATEIPALVDHARAGGLAVELRTQGDLSRIPAGVGVAVYRIAQEALANASLHAPRARTVLGLDLVDGQVHLVAETSGPVVAPLTIEPERPHYGLIGMRERATALGGEFAAGPTSDGWQVSCRLPLDDGLPERDGSST
jgi:signal transduction histidine kinase